MMTATGRVPVLRDTRLAAVSRIKHGFFRREGGVSRAPCESLNISQRVGDEPRAVAHNRAALLGELDLPPSAWRHAHQVHGSDVRIVTADTDAHALEDASADGLVTTTPHLALAIVTADCVPLLMAEGEGRGVAAVHAGWRGTAASIAVAGVEALCRATSASPENIVVALGPAIGPCCFEVGDEVVAALTRALGEASVARATSRPAPRAHAETRAHLDLWQLNVEQLALAGVRPESIGASRVCTVCHVARYFSHRKERGQCGRQGSVIALDA